MSLFDQLLTNNYTIFPDEDEQPKKKRKTTNKQVKKPTDTLDSDITSKTSYSNTTGSSTSTTIKTNPLFDQDEPFYISHEDLFKQHLDKEKLKFKEKTNKKRKRQQQYDEGTDKLTNELIGFFCDDINIQSYESLSSQSSSQQQYHDDDDGEECDNDEECESLFTVDDNECFLCSFGNSSHDSIYSKDLKKLREIYSSYRPFVQDEVLANMLALYFKKNVWNPNSDMPFLTAKNALMHIKNFGKSHTLNADEHIIESIKLWSEIKTNIIATLNRPDGKCDKDQFNCLEKTQKIINELYKQDSSKLRFNDPNCRIDTTGSLFKNMVFNENDEKNIRLKQITQSNIGEKKRTIDIH
jgi:hypothetical protein